MKNGNNNGVQYVFLLWSLLGKRRAYQSHYYRNVISHCFSILLKYHVYWIYDAYDKGK
jgi:hypothetical protein